MATLRLTCVNVLKAKDRGGMGVPARSRAVASAPASVKALRFAPIAGAAPFGRP
jgi:hypothetical protein